jgi:hypothetical protein
VRVGRLRPLCQLEVVRCALYIRGRPIMCKYVWLFHRAQSGRDSCVAPNVLSTNFWWFEHAARDSPLWFSPQETGCQGKRASTLLAEMEEGMMMSEMGCCSHACTGGKHVPGQAIGPYFDVLERTHCSSRMVRRVEQRSPRF